MKWIVNFVAAAICVAALHGAAGAQPVQNEAAIVSAAQPAIDRLLSALPGGSTLSPTQVFVDDLGQAHVRLAQFYRNIPVFEGSAVIHLDAASGRILGATDATLPFAALNVTPSVSAQRADDVARAHFSLPPGLASKRDLAIVVKDGAPALAWHVRREGSVSNAHVDAVAFVGTQDGKVLRSWNNLQTASAAGTAKGMFMDPAGSAIAVDQAAPSTFYLRNPGTPTYYTCDMRNGRSSCSLVSGTTSSFGTGTISTSGVNAAADAEYGAERTIAFYNAKFGRAGIDNANMSTYSRVHYSRS